MPITSPDEKFGNRLAALERAFDAFTSQDKPGSQLFTATYVPFGNASGALSSDSNFQWNNTLKALGIGGAPVAKLDVINGYIRATDGTNTAPASGKGLELVTTGGASYMQGYDRSAASYLQLNIQGDPIVLNTINANVGIGVTAPTVKLHINSANVGDGVYIGSSAPVYELGNTSVFASATMHGIFALSTSAGHYSQAAGTVLLAAYGNSRGNIHINSNFSGTGTTHLLLQPSTGNVLIGGTTVTRLLALNAAANTYFGLNVANVEKWLIGAETARFVIYDVPNGRYMHVIDAANIGLGGAPSAGGGTMVVFIANAVVVPTTNPAGGGILYVQAGALKYRGSAGTVTNIANA